MRTIAEKWTAFSSTLPAGISDTMMRMLQITFYSGSKAMVELEHEVASDTSISDEALVAIMEGLTEELGYFFHISKPVEVVDNLDDGETLLFPESAPM